MPTAAPAPGVAAPKSEAPPAPLGPDEQERIVAARGMILLIVPLYFLILLTLKADARYRIARIGAALELSMDGFLPYIRGAYHAMIGLACAAPALYAALGIVRLARRGGSRRALTMASACLAIGLAEAAAIAAAVYYFKVAV
jgi:hypothetical protein